MGFNRHTPSALLYAPRREGGAGLKDLFIEQGPQKAMWILRHVRANTTAGTLFLALLEWFQQNAGVSYRALDCPHIPIKYVKNPWLQTFREFLALSKITMDLPVTVSAQLKRAGDVLLMEAAQRWTGSTSELKHINACRLYMQVDSMADITDMTGTELQQAALFGNRSQLASSSTLLWPDQPQPYTESWEVWRKFLAAMTRDGNKLREPLGEWSDHLTRRFPAYYDTVADLVVIRREKDFGFWTPPPNSRRRGGAMIDIQHPFDTEQSWTPQQHCIPLQLSNNSISWPPQKASNSAAKAVKGSDQQWRHRLIHHKTLHVPYDKLSELFQNTSVIHIVVQSWCGTGVTNQGYCFQLLDQNDILHASGRGGVWGNPVDAQRCELFGVLAGLNLLQQLSEILDTSDRPCLQLYLSRSGNKILQSGTKHRGQSPRWWMQRNSDVASQIIADLRDQRSKLNIKPGKNCRPTNPVHWIAQRLKKMVQPQFPALAPFRFLTCRAIMRLREEIITGDESYRLAEAYWSDRYFEYTTVKLGWGRQSSVYGVEARYLALASITDQNERVFILKLSHLWLPVRGHPSQQGHSPTCPRCHGGPESQSHMLWCPLQREWRIGFVQRLEAQLTKIRTYPNLNRYLVGFAQAVFLADDPVAIRHSDIWEYALQGYLPMKWVNAQHLHMLGLGRPQGGTTWGARLIRFLWEECRQAWRLRCEAVHGSEDESAAQRLRDQVSALYERSSQLSVLDRRLFAVELEERMKLPRPMLERWVDRVKPIVARGLARVRRRIIEGNRDIREFFTVKENKIQGAAPQQGAGPGPA